MQIRKKKKKVVVQILNGKDNWFALNPNNMLHSNFMHRKISSNILRIEKPILKPNVVKIELNRIRLLARSKITIRKKLQKPVPPKLLPSIIQNKITNLINTGVYTLNNTCVNLKRNQHKLINDIERNGSCESNGLSLRKITNKSMPNIFYKYR